MVTKYWPAGISTRLLTILHVYIIYNSMALFSCHLASKFLQHFSDTASSTAVMEHNLVARLWTASTLAELVLVCGSHIDETYLVRM